MNRNFNLKALFHNKNKQKQETKLASKEPSFKIKTHWGLKEKHHTVKTFIEAVNKDIMEKF